MQGSDWQNSPLERCPVVGENHEQSVYQAAKAIVIRQRKQLLSGSESNWYQAVVTPIVLCKNARLLLCCARFAAVLCKITAANESSQGDSSEKNSPHRTLSCKEPSVTLSKQIQSINAEPPSSIMDCTHTHISAALWTAHAYILAALWTAHAYISAA